MRIVFCAYQFSDATNGGASTLVWELANGMAERGHEVLVVTCSDGVNTTERLGKVRVARFKMPLSFHGWGQNLPSLSGASSCWEHSVEFYRASLKTIQDFNPDIIEVPECYALGLTWAMERKYPLAVRLVCPAFLLFESGYVGAIAADDIKLVKAMELFAIGAADARIGICHELVERLCSMTEIPKSDFDVVRVPLRMRELPEQTDSEKREHFPDLFYFGRVEAQKGTETLIEALPIVAKEFPGFRLTMAGSHSPDFRQPGTHVAVLKKRVEELGLQDRVFFPGHISIEEIRSSCRNADISVFPSTYETACYAAIEAISYGGCVLATAVGGLPEYVKHDESGWLVESQNPQMMAEAIIKLAKDAGLRQRLRDTGPASVKQICDPEKSVEESLVIYEKAIARFRNRAISPNLAFPAFLSLFRDAFRSEGMLVKYKELAWP